MAGTIKGGRKAAVTNKVRYGDLFYTNIGRKGGKLSHGGAFGKDPQFASKMGMIGGSMSPGTGKKHLA